MAERIELRYFRGRRLLVPSYQTFGTVVRVTVENGFTFHVKFDSSDGASFKLSADDVCLRCTETQACKSHHADALARAVRQVLEDVHDS